jgi:hypothetical protein
MRRREFEAMRRREMARAEAEVEALRHRFDEAKTKLIQAKQELNYWRGLTWEMYVDRN